MKSDSKIIEKVLISSDEINEKIKELAEKISDDYKDSKDLVVVGVLNGSVIFMSQLVLNMELDLTIDFIKASSYGDGTVSSGKVNIIKDMDIDARDRDILIVEDIVDTGNTLKYLQEDIKNRGAKSVRIVSLLNKPARRTVDVNIDYVGFDIPDEFVIGYGMDYSQKYRNLDSICILKREVYEKE
ncbi:MAG: hypoxanthine phosphoribosyltransferase [Finegoldia sp.]|nr:hypoxanthine phosphoribosyltransferase [Finegoldia sp.]